MNAIHQNRLNLVNYIHQIQSIFAKKIIKITREIENLIVKRMFSGKAIVVIGARQVGKTTSVLKLLQSYTSLLILDGDDRIVRELLNEPSTEEIRNIIGNNTIVFIDEVYIFRCIPVHVFR